MCYAIIFTHILGYHSISLISLSYFIFCLTIHKDGWVRVAITAITALFSLYYPVSKLYGKISPAIVYSTLETNKAETLEFLNKLNIIDFALPILTITLIATTPTFTFKTKSNKQITTLLLIILIGINPVKNVFSNTNYSRCSELIDITPIKFSCSIYEQMALYFRDLHNAKENITKHNFHNVEHHKYNKNHVIIIGESARKNLFNSYGFHMNNSPFLSSVNATVFDGLYSPTSYTAGSIVRFLSKNQKEKFIIEDNIVNLANSANIKTHWFSNQGFVGQHDSITSKIALLAQHIYFMKTYDYKGYESKDEILLPIFESAVKNNTHNSNLFILHTMGSHSNFCKRIKERKFTYANNDLSCYISSIYETDQFIKHVKETLDQENNDYSIIYFSDHALSFTRKNELEHSDEYIQSYEVPFLIIDRDDTGRNIIKRKISWQNFFFGLSNWLDVTYKDNPTYSFKNKKNDDKIELLINNTLQKTSYFKSDIESRPE